MGDTLKYLADREAEQKVRAAVKRAVKEFGPAFEKMGRMEYPTTNMPANVETPRGSDETRALDDWRAEALRDWTTDETGHANSSEEFERLVAEVARLIQSETHVLDERVVQGMARLIMAQLAHKQNVGPLSKADPDTAICGDDSWDSRYECRREAGHAIDGPGLTSHDYRPKRGKRADPEGRLPQEPTPDTVSVPRAVAVQRLRSLIHGLECRRNPRCNNPDSHRAEGWGDPPFQGVAEAWLAALSSEPEPEEPPYGS